MHPSISISSAVTSQGLIASHHQIYPSTPYNNQAANPKTATPACTFPFPFLATAAPVNGGGTIPVTVDVAVTGGHLSVPVHDGLVGVADPVVLGNGGLLILPVWLNVLTMMVLEPGPGADDDGGGQTL